VEIAGTIHRESRKESNEKRVGLHDLIVCGVESHVQSPSARTIGRLMIQPVMQQERRTSAMRCLQEKKGHPSPDAEAMPRRGMSVQAITSNEASPLLAGSMSTPIRRW
jgi:hypothetical protein